MTLPLLPSEHIAPTFDDITSEFESLTIKENIVLFQRYYKKQWLKRIGPLQLSIFACNVTTNNGAESYHAKISKNFKSNHPNIWNFCETLNNVIIDTDADIARLKNGLDISRIQKKDQLTKNHLLKSSKDKLLSETYTPIDFIAALRTTIDSIQVKDNEFDDNESFDNDYSGDSEQVLSTEVCCVCLLPRENTICFRPCWHARVCSRCDQVLKDSSLPCPVCRSIIQDRFEIY